MDPNFDLRLFLLTFPMFLFSLCVHEWAHAYTAYKGGDDTSRLLGRMSLNPLVHIDPIGTLLMPLLSAMVKFPLFGWAKPVPVNMARLKHSVWMVYVAIAGPLSNVAIVIALVVVGKLVGLVAGQGSFGTAMAGIENEKLGEAISILFRYGILINLGLAIFNMMPIAPLDGSKVLFHFAVNGKPHLYPAWEQFERFGFLGLYLLFILTPVGTWLGYVIFAIYNPLRMFLG